MYTHIQRVTLQNLFKAVAKGADPYKAADEVVNILNANYDLKTEEAPLQCMNCDRVLDKGEICYCLEVIEKTYNTWLSQPWLLNQEEAKMCADYHTEKTLAVNEVFRNL